MESFGYLGAKPRKNGIFISYRREDTAWPARCLYERLKSEINPVFMDVGSIQGGDNFPNEIRYHMSNCGILLALIGHDWMGTANLKRARRIDTPEDWVHIEIKTALEGNIWAVPVLIDGAKMPKAGDLPEGLRPLTQIHAFTLSHNNFDREIEDLTTHVDAIGKGYRILQGKWSLKLQESEGPDHIFRLSSDTRDYLIGISLTSRGKSAIAVGSQVEATANTAASIAGEEIDLTALSSELGTRATIKVEISNPNPPRSYRNKPESGYCFTLRVGDRVFNYETEEYAQAEAKKQAEQERELAEGQREMAERQRKLLQTQWGQQQRVQNTEQARQALKYTVIGESIGIGLNAALKNEAVREALKNALRRARR